MYSKKSYSSGTEDVREYNDAKTGREAGRPSFISSLCIGPKEDKIEREIYPTKEASERVSENTTKSFVTRSVIDKRSTSSYRTSEKIQSVKSRDLPGYSGREATTDPISSFYSSYSKDEDLRDAAKVNQLADKSEDVISSFYRSSVGFRKDRENGESIRATSYKAAAAELRAAKGVSWRNDRSRDSSSSLKGRSSLQSIKEADKENGGPTTINSENINILRRALERKDASNSLDRERLSKKFSEDDSIDLSKHTSKAHVNLSGKHEDSDSHRKTTLTNTSKSEKDDVVGRRETFDVHTVMQNGKASDWGIFPREIKARSRSTESLNEKKRDRSGIFREVPGRSEFLSHSRSLSDFGTTGSDDDKRFSRESRRTGSLDRNAGFVDRWNRADRNGRSSSLSRLRSRSSEELRPSYEDKQVYPSYRSRALHRQGNFDREGSFRRDETNRRDSRMGEMRSSTRDKLREDIARLKAEAENRTTKKDVKLYSFSQEPTIHDKLKEDIAKLKAETLTRDHVKPYVPPPSLRPASANISSRWRSREPSIQDRLKEDIARLKAEAEKMPSFPKRTSDVTTEIIIPDRRMEDMADVRHGGISRTLVERYNVSNNDGVVFKDVSRNEETKRFGDAKNPKEDEITRRRGSLRNDQPKLRNEFRNVEKSIGDEVPLRPPADYFHPFSDRTVPSSTRTTEGAVSVRSTRPPLWPKENENGSTERENLLTTPRDISTDPSNSSKFQSAEAYASKRVFKADSIVSISSSKEARGGPSSVQGHSRGSISTEGRSAYYYREMGDKENGIPDSILRRSYEEIPKPAALPRPRDDTVRLPHSRYESVTHGRKYPASSPEGLQGEPGYEDWRERDERRSVRVHSNDEFVTRKTIRDDSVISRKRWEDDTPRSLSSKVESPRHIPERSKPSPRRTSTREDKHISEENKTRFCEEIDAPLPEYKEIKTSPVISELRKKIEQLKDKVDTLDDRRARMKLERYVDDHSERKPDVDIKPPVHIKRYQPTEFKPGSGSEVDGPDSLGKRESITSETISRQISRQTSTASTLRQISSIQDDVRTTPQSHAEEVISPTSKPDQKPAVMKQMCDAQTMTPPDVQQNVVTTVVQRQDSIVDERDRLKELRGVPIDYRRTTQIEEVDREQVRDNGVTMIQVDSHQQTISPKKDVQEWWNAFTAEDVDRLLKIGNWSPWNAYTAEDVDRMFHVGPVRRRSFHRRSLRRYPKIRQYKDDPVDVLVRVRGRREKHRRPQCIIAQAAPEEKAIVLRETKETTEPYIRTIKVDDVYGADAVRVENGVVKIKVGDKGRKTWGRILQKKNDIFESDGIVTVPVSGDQCEDGMYYTSHYKGQQQDGKVRTPIKFKIQEQNAAKSNKIRVAREMRRTGSMRRRRKAAASSLCPYIVGARYYRGKILLTCADAHRSQNRAQSGHQEIVVRQPQSSSKVTGNEIVLRRNSQPPAFPVKTIQRIHEGHKTTSHAATTRAEDGKMIITVHAVPPRPQRFSLKQAGQNMTSSSYHGKTSEQRGVSSTSGNYLVSSTSGPQGYVTSSRPSREGNAGTSYYVTDPSDSFGRRSGYHSASRYHSSNELSSTPTIIPYEDGPTSRRGTQSGSFITDPSSYYGFYDAPGSRIVSSDPRLNARTGYGEKFNLRDHGGLSSVRYVNGARQGSRIINERMKSNGHYRYGSSWNSTQQDTLNGRSMSWAVEVVPDF